MTRRSRAEYQKEWRRRNPLKQREYSAKWRAKNPRYQKDWYAINTRRAIEASAKYRRLARYGLGVDEFNSLLKKQGGRCAICAQNMRPACVDHSHSSGTVRGLLCRRCNLVLGWIEKYPDLPRMAKRYLKKYGRE